MVKGKGLLNNLSSNPRTVKNLGKFAILENTQNRIHDEVKQKLVF